MFTVTTLAEDERLRAKRTALWVGDVALNLKKTLVSEITQTHTTKEKKKRTFALMNFHSLRFSKAHHCSAGRGK